MILFFTVQKVILHSCASHCIEVFVPAAKFSLRGESQYDADQNVSEHTYSTVSIPVVLRLSSTQLAKHRHAPQAKIIAQCASGRPVGNYEAGGSIVINLHITH